MINFILESGQETRGDALIGCIFKNSLKYNIYIVYMYINVQLNEFWQIEHTM